MAIRQKIVVTMKEEGKCLSHSRTEVTVRDQALTIDEPEARGGTNQGPSPTETLLASLVGCTNVIFHKCAAKHGVDIQAMHVGLEARFDRRGVTLEEEIAIPFPEVTLTIDLTTGADPETMERAKTDLARFCPVSKVLRQAGTVIHEVWNVTRG